MVMKEAMKLARNKGIVTIHYVSCALTAIKQARNKGDATKQNNLDSCKTGQE
jgi:hypothetical protein